MAKRRRRVSSDTPIKDLRTHPKPYVTAFALREYAEISDDKLRRDIKKGALGEVVRPGGGRKILIPTKNARAYMGEE